MSSSISLFAFRDRELLGGAEAGLCMSLEATMFATAWISAAALCFPKIETGEFADAVGVVGRYKPGGGDDDSDISLSEVSFREKSLVPLCRRLAVP